MLRSWTSVSDVARSAQQRLPSSSELVVEIPRFTSGSGRCVCPSVVIPAMTELAMPRSSDWTTLRPSSAFVISTLSVLTVLCWLGDQDCVKPAREAQLSCLFSPPGELK